jgi:hypothetical protein
MGKTWWTAIEELAIKERMFEGNWQSLLFVTLDARSTLPAWLPQTHIRLDYQRFGDALARAIKLKAVEAGSELQAETALGKAQRTVSFAAARRDRAGKLAYLTPEVIAEEWKKLYALLADKTV